MQRAREVSKCHYYEDEHDKMWMDEIAGHFEWDDSHPQIRRLPKPGNKVNDYAVEAAASKNLHSERKRRKKLNDNLYTLRSVVPNISKMDKQSIVEDAISHVLDLQKKIAEIEGEIKGLCNSNKGDDHTQITPHIRTPPTKPNLEDRSATESESGDAKKWVNKLKDGKVLEAKIVEINKAGKDGMYHVRMECNKDASALVDLTRAVESVPLEIVNSNICRFHQAIHCTLYVRSLENAGADELGDMILQTISSNYSS